MNLLPKLSVRSISLENNAHKKRSTRFGQLGISAMLASSLLVMSCNSEDLAKAGITIDQSTQSSAQVDNSSHNNDSSSVDTDTHGGTETNQSGGSDSNAAADDSDSDQTNDTAKDDETNSDGVSATVSSIDDADFVIQEQEVGFCGLQGTIDKNNNGYTGSGFANSDNATGASITWRVKAESAGDYAISWRFANGKTSNRPADVYVNDALDTNSDFAPTSSWSDWADTEKTTVSLVKGFNKIRLQATSDSGLANIDYVSFYGDNLAVGDCNASNDDGTSEEPDNGSGTDGSVPDDVVLTGDKPTIWYASDSTVRHYKKSNSDQQGVGQRLPEFLTADVSIANYAKGGRAINSFKRDGFWGQIIDGAKPGDVILIQFGINDRGDLPDKEAFKDYLRQYVNEARAIEAIPVFVTPTPRNQNKNGVFTNAFTKYCEAKEEIGEEMGVTVIDLQTKGRDFYTEIGVNRVTNEMMKDSLHLLSPGAYHMARLLAEGISESNLYPLREKVIIENLDPTREESVDGWNPRDVYTYN